MNQLHIGIIAPRLTSATNSFDDNYKLINNYVRAVARPGTIPYGVVFPDGEFHEPYLDIYDGFILQGGPKIHPYHLGVLHYAYTYNKPVLGICLGCQAIGIYSNLLTAVPDPNYQNLLTYYQAHQDDPLFQLRKVEGHSPSTDYNNEMFTQIQHPIQLQPDTYLRRVFQSGTLSVPSLHSYALAQVNQALTINALSQDIIEGVELINDQHFLLGVQFHPELSSDYSALFDAFLSEARTRHP